MDATVIEEIEGLQRANLEALRRRYREVFGEEPGPTPKQRLFRQLAWRLQMRAEGDLSERARQRALELADDAELRRQGPKRFFAEVHRTIGGALPAGGRSDRRQPPPGTVLTRRLRDRTVLVKVLDVGFEFEGRTYRSLSAIATEVTGTRWNGWAFFGLTAVPRSAPQEEHHAGR